MAWLPVVFLMISNAGESAHLTPPHVSVNQSQVDADQLRQLEVHALLLYRDPNECVRACTECLRQTPEISPAFSAAVLMQRSCAKLMLEGLSESQNDFLLAIRTREPSGEAFGRLFFAHALTLRARLLRSPSAETALEQLIRELPGSAGTVSPETRLLLWCEALWCQLDLRPNSTPDFEPAGNLATLCTNQSIVRFLEVLRVRHRILLEGLNRETLGLLSDWIPPHRRRSLPDLVGLEVTRMLLDKSIRRKDLTSAIRHAHEMAVISKALDYPNGRIEAHVRLCELGERVDFHPAIAHHGAEIRRAHDPALLLKLMACRTEGLMPSSMISVSELERIVGAQIRVLADLERVAVADIAEEFSVEVERLRHQESYRQRELVNAMSRNRSSESWFWTGLYSAGTVVVILFGFLVRDHVLLRSVNHRLSEEIEKGIAERSERERMELRIAQTERLESLGTLAGGVAHDFNNLLVGVIGNAELLRQVVTPEPVVMECLDGILRSAETAADLSRKMLAYAGKEPATKCVVDLNDVVSKMLPLLRSGLSCRHLIEFAPDVQPLPTEADTGQLEQILMNLVSNSAQAMQERPGRVTLRTGVSAIDSPRTHTQLFGNRIDGGEFVWFEVTDNGTGISEADISRVFQPFFTTRSRSHGHGFGLAVVYGHVNRHDGLIQVHSAPEAGTTIRILLPRAHTTTLHSIPIAPREQAELSSLSASAIVVAVDDQQSVLDVVRRACEQVGFESHTFRSATEGLEFIADHPQIDCILLDMMMPEFDGYSMLQELCQRGILIPVIVMSGYSSSSTDSLTGFQNVYMTIQKPFRKSQLIGAVQAAIQSRSAGTGTHMTKAPHEALRADNPSGTPTGLDLHM